MLVSDLLEHTTPEALAERLAAAGVRTAHGKEPSPHGIRSRRNGPIPSAWVEALPELVLEVGDTPPTSLPPASERGDDENAGDGKRRRESTPPRRPAGAKVTLPAVEPGAAKRIAGAYKFVGAALAAGVGPEQGGEGVAAVFTDQSDTIAKLWVEAAAENPWAARFVNLMNTGGTGGELVGAHVYLLGATFYVLGAGIPGGDSIFAKYSRYRPRPAAPAAPPAAEPEPEPEPVVPGAAAAAAPGAVVDGSG